MSTTDLTHFNFHGQDVRTAELNGAPAIVLSDIAKVLGYRDAANASRILRDHHKGYSEVSTPSGSQRMLVVTEQGFNRLVIRSNASNAEAVQDWVTDDVLPEIRKTGGYAQDEPHDVLMARALIAADRTLKAVQQRVAELEPPAKAWTALAAAEGDYSLRDAAQVLSRDPAINIGQNRLARLLRSIHWIDARGIPYQQHVDTGRIRSRARTYKHPRTGEEMQADPQVRITGKGLTWLHQHLEGVEPLTEQPPLMVVS